MRKIGFLFFTLLVNLFFSVQLWALSEGDLAQKVKAYFEDKFSRLEAVAGQYPELESYRHLMRPEAEKIEGFFGGSLIDADFVIRQVYHPSHFLARGYDLKKVKELKYFYKKMMEDPTPQLSEPGRGSLLQPRLIAMRYPVIKDGKLEGIISMMVRTEYFLRAVGLDKCKAFKIICRGDPAEEKGVLSDKYKEITLDLPSTQWKIQYEE